MQSHCRLTRVGDSVNGLLDVHAAACGLIQDPALSHPVAQGGACGRVSHSGQRSVIGAGLGVLLGAPAFAGAMAPFPRGAEGGHAARRRRRFRGRAAHGGLRYFLQVEVRARVLLWGVSFAASESQRPDDLVCCVQRRRSGACFAWGRGFRHCCVAVPKSGGWGADFPWLVHVLWAQRGVNGGARTLVLRAGVRVCVWVLGTPPPRSVVAPLRGASEAGRPPPSGCPPPWGLLGPAVHVLWARVCGYGVQHCPRGPYSLCSSGAGSRGFAARVSRVRSVRAWGPSTGPKACALVGQRCALWGWRKGVPGEGAFPRCEGRLRSGASPPPTARPPARLSGSATHVLRARCAAVGAQHCPFGLHAPWGLCAAGVVRQPFPGGLPPL